MSPVPSVLVSCVGENRPDWIRKMENLVLSLRTFGGSLSGAPMLVNVVGGADPATVKRLARLDAEIRPAEPFDRRLPTSNKLRMLEVAAERDFDVLIGLDCDVIVKGDLGPETSPVGLRALPAGRDHFTDATWRRFYEVLGLPLPAKDCVMTVTGEHTYPYFNSGVLFVPREVCGPLREHWSRHLEWVLGPGPSQLGVERVRKDQVPLAAALASAGLHVDPLPVNLNLSVTAPRPAKAYRRQWGPPFILHYHNLLDEHGFLQPSPNRAINQHLDEFNRARARELGGCYGGLGQAGLRRRASASLKTLPWYRHVGRVRRALAGRHRRR